MDTIVKTRYGEVRGSVADGVNTFKGIPYRGATVWRQSAPTASSQSSHGAACATPSTFGPEPPQPPYPPTRDLGHRPGACRPR